MPTITEIFDTGHTASPVISETISVSAAESLPAASAELMTPSEIAEAKSGKAIESASPTATHTPADASPTPAPEPQDKASKRFAALSRKEKALREKETSLKAQAEQVASFQELQQLAQRDPIAFTQRFGISPDTYVNSLIGNPLPTLTPEQQVVERMNQLEHQIKQEAQKKENEVMNNKISDYKASVISPLLAKNTEKYELIQSVFGSSASDEIWDAIDARLQLQPYNFKGPEDALRYLLETADAMEEELFAQGQKFATSKKLGGKSISPNSLDNTSRAPITSKTLTNKLAPPAAPVQSNKGLTPEQSKARAARWLQEQMDREKLSNSR